jgi:predicted amidohydrolase YtcJ
LKILFTNGLFYSMNREGEIFRSVLTEDGYIRETFPDKTEDNIADEIVDLEGSAVFPGFTDTHTHSFSGGVALSGIDLGNVKSIKEILTLLSAKQESNLGFVLGWRFDESLVSERRFPTLEELDSVQPDRPIVLRRVDGHSCVLNSKAMKMVSWRGKPPKRGLLTGKRNYQGITYFHNQIDSDGIIEAYHNAARAARKAGLTAVHTMVGDGAKDSAHYKLLSERRSEFEVDYILYPQVLDVRECLKLGADRIGGCILADGSFGSRTAALTEPYVDIRSYYGKPYRRTKFWKNFVQKANRYGLMCAIHAIGDRAIGQVTSAYLYSRIKSGFQGNMIIHNELLSDQLILDQKSAGIISVMQPLFDRLWGGEKGFYAKILGKERALSCNRLKSLSQAGIPVTGSSDWYITELDILSGLQAAISIHNPEERLTPYQSIELYTSQAEMIEDNTDGETGRNLGKILPGYRADFCCFDKDPIKINSFKNISIKKMVRKGKVVSCG